MVQADTVDFRSTIGGIQPLESTYIFMERVRRYTALNATCTYLKLEKEVYSGRDAWPSDHRQCTVQLHILTIQ